MIDDIARARLAALTRHSGGYSRAQIILHWTIAAIVLAVLFTHEEFLAIQSAMLRGSPVTTGQVLLRGFHLWGGALVFPLAVCRLIMRLRLGVPAPPRRMSRALRAASSVTHTLLYVLIFLMPVSGVLVHYRILPLVSGALHQFGEPALIVLVNVHTIAALMHHFYWKTDVLRRMLKSRASTT
jgi:cytochrome b561